ncbi:GPW/gp25 family protein [Halalkalicoccus salilacus]|uniref:GPW/gp25 family protein n=1 Tax=Halalkalicoccus salilacus TaxID=3117459 RepID=UPI00300EC6E7
MNEPTDTRPDRAFLGRGWQFPPDPDNNGHIELAAGREDVEQAIRIILGTAKGERVMRPEFGCGIHEYVFTEVNTTMLKLIEDSVQEALVRWEPRIDVQNVEATVDDAKAGQLLVRINYLLRSSNTEFNMVYPFYLGES